MKNRFVTSGYAVCRNTPDGVAEDADFCPTIDKAYESMKFYTSIGSKVWLEPRHIRTIASED